MIGVMGSIDLHRRRAGLPLQLVCVRNKGSQEDAWAVRPPLGQFSHVTATLWYLGVAAIVVVETAAEVCCSPCSMILLLTVLSLLHDAIRQPWLAYLDRYS